MITTGVPRGLAVVLAIVLIAGCDSAPAPTSPGTSPGASPGASVPGTTSPSASAETPASPSIEPSLEPSASPSPAPGATATPADGNVAKSSVARVKTTSADARAGADATNALAVDLYRRLAKGGDNLVFSPTSIMLALGLARPGARGTTASQMDDVMGNAATAKHARWLNALDAALADRTRKVKDSEGTLRSIRVRIANQAFLQQGYPYQEAYLDELARRFAAGVRLVDYIDDPTAARAVINDWVKKKTEGAIPRLLGPTDISPATRFALVNAIYMQAPWKSTFSPEDTSKASFTLANGTVVKVPTMVGPKEMSWIRYAKGSGWRGAELPYLGGDLAMTVILPKDRNAFGKDLTAGRLAGVVSAIAKAPLEYPNPDYPDDPGIAWKIALPKFSFQTRSDLAKVLGAAGMPDAFDPNRADFTGIVDPAQSGEAPLFVRKVIHQATIEVDERGTTATAATAIIGETGGGPETRIFHVDQPFLFVIRDVPTGAILFIGRVMDPRAG